MSRFFTHVAALCLVLLIAGSCSEDNITQYQMGGAIYGRVTPAGSGIQVSAWQAALVKSTSADTSGYFTLTDLTPGLYEVRIQAPTGASRTIHDVSVDVAKATSLGTIAFSRLPSPLTQFLPVDGARNVVPLNPGILLMSDAALDISSLDEAASFNPSLPGHWGSGGYSSNSYSFIPDTPLRAATTYTISIGPNLKLADGTEWANTYHSTFSTQSMALVGTRWLFYGSSSPDSVWPGFTGALLELTYNTLIDASTLDGAIQLTPSAEYSAELVSYSRDRIDISIEGGLVSGTSYNIIVNRSLSEVHGSHPATVDTVAFGVQKFQAIERQYPSSRSSVPPRVSGPLIEYAYNLALDQSSLSSAITIEPAAPISAYTTSWENNRTLYVTAPEGLRPSTSYTLTIGSALASIDGGTVGQAESVQFQTQSLAVTQFVVSSSNYGGSDTILDPGASFYSRVYLNATVDVDSFNVAASFSPAIQGFWYLQHDYSDEYLDFFTTGGVDLLPEQSYTLTIRGSVGLVGVVGFGADVQKRFATRPVTVVNLYPSPGSRGVYPYSYPRVDFNVDMDQASTEAAFEMRTYSGTPVLGSFSWSGNREFSFYPSTPLQAGETYVCTVSTAALSQSGHALKEGTSTFFTISD